MIRGGVHVHDGKAIVGGERNEGDGEGVVSL
jgi:hypothetical protein